jgi:signal transduction histidine kinase
VSRSLSSRVRWSLVAVAALTLVAVFAVFYGAWRVYTVRVRSDELAVQVGAIAKGLDAAETSLGGSASSLEIRQRLFRVEAGLIGARLVVVDVTGLVLRSSAASGTPEGVRYPLALLGALGADGTRRGQAFVQGSGDVLLVAAPLTGGRELVAVQPLREVRQARGWVLVLLGGSALVALLVALAAGVLLARRIGAPLKRLTVATETLGAGDWGHQVPVEGDDEVASLARSFNGMSRRLGEAYEAQKAFVGDVSHELRTPITSIQGFAGALVDGTVTEPEQQRRYLGVIRDEASRLGDLTRTLLSLSELEAGTVAVSRGPVDVSGLSEALTARYASRAVEAGRTLRLELLSGTPRGDDARLLQAVSALVDNALAYTPDGGTIVVRSENGAGMWRLIVEDSGPGIPPERREAVFGRFTRLDTSRSADSGGSGLGLAITRRIVELMGGRIWAEESALGGARFVLELPSA